jgi:pimeloyl-ACP methyl ester carboxylesterase
MRYDEFSLFPGNAAELGIDYIAPTVRREFVTVDPSTGQRVSALVWGDAAVADIDLVLIHGGAQNAHTWDSVALCLDRPLIAIDLPGHGHSDHRADHAYWPHENASSVATALRELAPQPRLVVGMSLGGLTSVALAEHAPDLVPELILVDVTPGVDEEKSKTIHQFIDGPEYFETFDEILERTIRFNPTRTEASLRRGVMHNAFEDPDGRWRWRYDLPRRGSGAGDDGQLLPGLASLWDAISASTMPLTLARGSTSPVVSDADVAELLRRRPDARVEVFEGAGHSIQGDQPRALADFLATRLEGVRR